MKTKTLAYLLWFFLAPFGVHRLYINGLKVWLIWLAVMVLTAGVGAIIWQIVDLFLIPSAVYAANERTRAMFTPDITINHVTSANETRID